MEELLEIYKKCESFNNKLEESSKEFILQLRMRLSGKAAVSKNEFPADVIAPTAPQNASPQQTTKRPKRLTSLQEDTEPQEVPSKPNDVSSTRLSKRTSNSELLAAVSFPEEVSTLVLPLVKPETVMPSKPIEKANAPPNDLTLMPPPANPTPSEPVNSEPLNTRPQRAAKLKSEKNLKEVKLNSKLRRPSHFDSTKIKVEHEQRASQMHEVSPQLTVPSKPSMSSIGSEDSVVVVLEKAPSVVDLLSEDDAINNKHHQTQATHDDHTTNIRQLRVMIKREKSSLSRGSSELTTFVPPNAIPKQKIGNAKEDSVLSSTISSSTSITTASVSGAPSNKKARKKKNITAHKPIKVERFSDVDNKAQPVASRTRHGNVCHGSQQELEKENQQLSRAASIYEDAVDNIPKQNTGITRNGIDTTSPQVSVAVVGNNVETCMAANPNETVTISSGKSNATFQVAEEQCTFMVQNSNDNPNSTVTLVQKGDSGCGANAGDVTFNLPLNTVACQENAQQQQQQPSFTSSRQSMETAKDTSNPQSDTLITEDESFVLASPVDKEPVSKVLVSKLPTSAKAYKMPTRTNELFNPLIQSPVKMKVKAFQNVVNAANTELTKSGRPKRTKENATPGAVQPSLTTPIIGKAHVPALGRFLTPTQMTNITPNVMVQAKKASSSASKAMTFPKSTGTASNLRSANSGSTKTLSRENSTEEFRKGLHLLAEERKKQREQKHLQAAQQREAKERERAERMAKMAREREEKRLKKQLEADQKKRELEEIQRKLRQKEEAAAAAAAEVAKTKAAKTKTIMDQERQLLQQMKTQTSSAKSRMMPPPPKIQSKYTFEMLHEDDSTDEECKTSYKRPPPPTWSRSHVRGEAILRQQYWPTDIIDSFFSVQPLTPDLKLIFPDIDVRHLKRNSSVLWSTPPRYSELPKY